MHFCASRPSTPSPSNPPAGCRVRSTWPWTQVTLTLAGAVPAAHSRRRRRSQRLHSPACYHPHLTLPYFNNLLPLAITSLAPTTWLHRSPIGAVQPLFRVLPEALTRPHYLILPQLTRSVQPRLAGYCLLAALSCLVSHHLCPWFSLLPVPIQVHSRHLHCLQLPCLAALPMLPSSSGGAWLGAQESSWLGRNRRSYLASLESGCVLRSWS